MSSWKERYTFSCFNAGLVSSAAESKMSLSEELVHAADVRHLVFYILLTSCFCAAHTVPNHPQFFRNLWEIVLKVSEKSSHCFTIWPLQEPLGVSRFALVKAFNHELDALHAVHCSCNLCSLILSVNVHNAHFGFRTALVAQSPVEPAHSPSPCAFHELIVSLCSMIAMTLIWSSMPIVVHDLIKGCISGDRDQGINGFPSKVSFIVNANCF